MIRWRRLTSVPQASSRYASRLGPAGVSRAARKMSRSLIGGPVGDQSPMRNQPSISATILVGIVEFFVKPGLGVGPKPLGRTQRLFHHFGRFLHGQADKETKPDQLGRFGVVLVKQVECFAESFEVEGRVVGHVGLIERNPDHAATMFFRLAFAGLL